VLQFGDRTTANQPGDSSHCAQCEAMLADVLDGTLEAGDQELFDLHLAGCEPCSQLLADAKRGAAWLEMLRDPAPEPSAELLERILLQTAGAQSGVAPVPGQLVAMGVGHAGVAAIAPGYAMHGGVAGYGNVVPFAERVVATIRRSSFGQVLLQPRLAMTAAMAFFSIALTMDLTGIHPLELRASDLSPGSLKRDFYTTKAHVVQYYEGLRVVYELESRVHDLEDATDNDVPAATQGTPAATGQPGSQGAPAAQPEQQNKPQAAPKPGKKPAPKPGSSHREDLSHSHRAVVAEVRDVENQGKQARVRSERMAA